MICFRHFDVCLPPHWEASEDNCTLSLQIDAGRLWFIIVRRFTSINYRVAFKPHIPSIEDFIIDEKSFHFLLDDCSIWTIELANEGSLASVQRIIYNFERESPFSSSVSISISDCLARPLRSIAYFYRKLEPAKVIIYSDEVGIPLLPLSISNDIPSMAGLNASQEAKGRSILMMTCMTMTKVFLYFPWSTNPRI